MTKPIIFVHIPKTAGTSVSVTSRKLGIHVKGHNMRDPNFQDLADLPNAAIKTFHFFTIVRNPWDRLVSAFTYLKNGGNSIEDESDYLEFIHPFKDKFEDFVISGLPRPKTLTQIHFRPQYEWVCSKSGDFMVHEILRFENLEEDFNAFIARHKRNRTVRLPKLNYVNRSKYKQFYSAKTKRIVENIYKKDVQLFHYEY